MNRLTKIGTTVCAMLAAAGSLVAPKPAVAQNPFEESVYLYNQAYDTDLNGPAGQGTGYWAQYKSWLGIANLGAEADPGWGPGDWYDCCQHVNWNIPWSTMQQRHGANLPTVILGMGQMPSDPNANDSWNQKLAWEDATWKLEANNDPTIMGYFANYAKEVDSLGFNKVIIRLGYEFDGGWNPFGNLNVMSNMPNNYIAAWQNIVNTMRANDPKHLIKFCWNPTDANVQIWAPSYYPGDAFVDYVGIDEYDFAYGGVYPVGTSQPTQAQRDAAWNNVELPRINVFADLARAHSKPMVIGEWGLWQLNDGNHPSGGDNTSYIQRMHDWMSDPHNNVASECYFEAPADGNSSLSGIFGATTFPNSAVLFKQLFSDAGSVPAAPTWYSLTPSNNSVALSWIWPAGATSFNVYRGTTPGGESATPIVSGDGSSNWTDNGLAAGTTYYYKLKAVNASGSSVYSAEASVTTTGSPVPATPTWSSLTPGTRSIFLSWYWANGATSFTIYRGTTPGGESATPIASGDTSSSWNDQGLTSGRKYYYKLKAVNSSGSSAMSAEASATAQ